MKSAQLDAFAPDPRNVRIVDAPVPEPGAGQIRVRMQLSPINPSDLNFVHGTYHSALQRIIWNQGQNQGKPVFYSPALDNPCPQPPYALGGEGMGTVDAVGPGLLAKRLKHKRVAVAGGPPNGCWQETIVVDAKKAVTLPDRISDEQGAMFFVNPLTAYVMTREVLKIPRGGWLLLTAAGSALGKSVVRLGQHYGFKTVCVVRSGSNSEELRRLGADAVVDTSQQNPVEEVFRITRGKGVGHAIDCVGGELTAEVVRCLDLGGKLVLYGTLGNSPLQLPVRDLMMPVAQISGFILPNWMLQQSPLTLLRVLHTVKRLTLKGVFTSRVSATFPLSEVADALAAATRPGRTGKVMLRIAPP